MGQNLHFWVNYPFNFSNELLQYFKMSKKKKQSYWIYQMYTL